MALLSPPPFRAAGPRVPPMAGAVIGPVAGAALAHALPSVTALGPVRRRLTPGLAGRGPLAHVALTFDDGPDPASTPRFLAELDRLGWKATFFMLGSMVRLAPGLAAEVAEAGHEVAVHGDVHRSHLLRSPRAVVDDVRAACATLAEATGRSPLWFRPPFGILSMGSLLAAAQLGLRPVLWTAWGRDWTSEATPGSVMAELDRTLGPGATVLLHDSDCTSDPGSWRAALGALPLLAERAAAGGWPVGPLRRHGLPLSPEPAALSPDGE
ncbi:MAG TPA: polysaccharide deacetylase family protein [Acidimicrobiales bacterium]|nr:polysaccharide deacetylase family protein [Acidimicrobiales bacterium]